MPKLRGKLLAKLSKKVSKSFVPLVASVFLSTVFSMNSMTPLCSTIHNYAIIHFITKFPYNACSDWLKQRALSEIRERVDGIKLASKYLLGNLDKFDPNCKHPLCDSDKININELFFGSKYG